MTTETAVETMEEVALKLPTKQLPTIDADRLIVIMGQLFVNLEQSFTITKANLRGALYTMIHKIDTENTETGE